MTVPALVFHTSCRICGGRLEPVMDLGTQYIPGWPTEAHAPGLLEAPLELCQCLAAGCHLVQLRHTVSPEELFREYWYRSGTNEYMRAALADVVDSARQRCWVEPGDAVADIGANDGTLLGFYDPLLARIAVEPARNVDPSVNADVVVNEFFPFPMNDSATGGKPKIITAIAMFYDLEDPGAFVEGIKKWLHPEGLFVVQVGYLLEMFKQNAFDAICHEHIEYYSLQSLVGLFGRHGLVVEDIDFNDVNGGSIRCYVRHVGAAEPSQYVLRQLQVENMAGLGEPGPILRFAARVRKIKEAIRDCVAGERAAGRPVNVYGASTKGLTLMQTVGLTSDDIGVVADRNPSKWGRYYGATGIPIRSEAAWRGMAPPGLAIVLPWHFKQGILARERSWRGAGGRFLFPLPEMEVV